MDFKTNSLRVRWISSGPVAMPLTDDPGEGRLQVLDGTANADRYITEVLEPKLLSSAHGICTHNGSCCKLHNFLWRQHSRHL